MLSRTKILFLVGMLIGASLASASQVSLAVSPGDPESLVLIEARCPTFSWAAVEGAESYELVAYRIGEEGENPEPVLLETLPGGVTAWTPSLDRCLERTGRYAWSVRATVGKGITEWSAAALFEVASGPAELELQQALEVVKRYLAVEATRSGLREASAFRTPQDQSVPTVAGSEAATPGVAAATVAASVDLLVTNGDIAVTSTSGLAFIQVDTSASAGVPSFTFCNEASEIGRMIYFADNNRFYVCDDASGWIDIN